MENTHVLWWFPEKKKKYNEKKARDSICSSIERGCVLCCCWGSAPLSAGDLFIVRCKGGGVMR